MKIIVAENEQRAREGICRLISSISEKNEIIAKASNGETALELIEQLKPDVVFTDIKMPFLDGIDMIQEVRNRGIAAEFVVISAHADFQYAQKCISLDVTEYMVKPITKSELEKVFERLEGKIEGQNVYMMPENESLKKQYPDAHPLVLRALDFIEEEYAKKISQNDLAQRLGISQQYFSYIFSKHMGEGFASFLKKYRIQQAEKLLMNSGQDKNEVAYLVGFSDVKYFQRVFREVTGKNVTEFRAEKHGQ